MRLGGKAGHLRSPVQLLSCSSFFREDSCDLVDHLNRASLSIAANIAEGNGRFTKADRKNFFIIARGAVQECVPLLEIARRRDLIQEETHQKLRELLEEIARMFSGLSNGLGKRRT